jgi:hypothetical protein
MMDLKKLGLGTGAAILTSGLVGGAAFAALAPQATTTAATARQGSVGGDLDRSSRGDRSGHLKAILDKLVAAGKITAAQEADILAAVNDAASAKARPDHASRMAVLHGLVKTATTYLGLDPKGLATQLHAGKSLGEIAANTPNKDRDGLVRALTDAATAKIDAAVAANTITADQATKLKAGLAAHVAKLVDHKAGPRPAKPAKP